MNDHSPENVTISITFQIHGDLSMLLPRPLAGRQTITHTITRRASIKDVIESLGIPHPIVSELIVNDRPVSFDYILRDCDHVEVIPLTPPVDFSTPSILRPIPLTEMRFLADANVGKLASLLRMAGIDTAYENHLTDAALADIAQAERRILLTKDISLLKRKKVEFGYLVREIAPQQQLKEIIHLFNLGPEVKPFTRCMHCNGILVPVAKEQILDRLEPLTKKYYHTFHLCPGCDKIYWSGSHKEKMLQYLNFVNETVSREK